MANIGYLKQREIEFLMWTGDNISDMKRFCKEDCSITYEIADGIDEYWQLKVYDSLLNEMVTVSVGCFIVKLSDDTFIVASATAFGEYFECFVKAGEYVEKD